MRGISRRPSPALVISVIALFVALGGTGYAAVKISGKSLKNGSVTGKKLKNQTITGAKVKPGFPDRQPDSGVLPRHRPQRHERHQRH